MFSRDVFINAVKDSYIDGNSQKFLLNPQFSGTIVSNLWQKISGIDFNAYGSTIKSQRLIAGMSVYNSFLPLRKHQAFSIIDTGKLRIIGNLKKMDDCILVEFCIDDPEDLMKSIKFMQKSGLNLKCVVSVIDTFNNVAEILKSNNIQYMPLLTKTDLENSNEIFLD